MTKNFRCLLTVISAVSLFVLSGCEQPSKSAPAPAKTGIDSRTIGELTSVLAYGQLQVKGFGLVIGLPGTGSSECPPEIKSQLSNYIHTKLPAGSKMSPEQLIESRDTAVVTILGLLPAGASIDEKFDIVVSGISSSQTTSLQGGRLMEAQLRQTGRLGQSRPMAVAEGAIFTPENSSPLVGYVLNGGKVIENQPIILKLRQPDFVTASIIRDRINSRFNGKLAIATSQERLTVQVPDEYTSRKEIFLGLLANLYIDDSAAARQGLIDELAGQMENSQNQLQTEYLLEGIGRPVANKIAPLLDSTNAQVRASAAKVLLTIGDYRGYQPLVDIAFSGSEQNRIDAMNNIAWNARQRDASGVMARLLSDDDLAVKLNAYEHLRRFDDISISRKQIETVNGHFDLERVVQGSRKIVWAPQTGDPRIVLFGSPIYCQDNIFIQSDDGDLMVNSRQDDSSVTIVQKNPITGKVLNIQCSNELGLIITRMSQVSKEKTVNGTSLRQTGLGVSYSDMIIFVKKMCEKEAVNAEFIYGPEPELKKSLKFLNEE